MPEQLPPLAIGQDYNAGGLGLSFSEDTSVDTIRGTDTVIEGRVNFFGSDLGLGLARKGDYFGGENLSRPVAIGLDLPGGILNGRELAGGTIAYIGAYSVNTKAFSVREAAQTMQMTITRCLNQLEDACMNGGEGLFFAPP